MLGAPEDRPALEVDVEPPKLADGSDAVVGLNAHGPKTRIVVTQAP
ncbi:hypothetical protein [Candidatus Palauibacter sp.]